MASIFITGSADGLGQLAAQRLAALGHDVVLHGRNRDRAQDAMRAVPGARTASVLLAPDVQQAVEVTWARHDPDLTRQDAFTAV
jgi:NAD(P)-dependent dehydrogenase (short-subunit alcohol dehydrogenase family)